MSRLAEVLGVEEKQPFCVKGENIIYYVFSSCLYWYNANLNRYTKCESYKAYQYVIEKYKDIEIVTSSKVINDINAVYFDII